MQIVSLKLLNFRNYNHLLLNFSANKNIICGQNGSGKTNLIEAIYVLALSKSFRGSTDKILINRDKNLAKVAGVVLDNIKKEYQVTISSQGKVAKIDGKRSTKLSDYISNINVVLFHPDSLRMIKDSPSVRRDNLNIDIAQFDGNYINILNSYDKILKQRNAYLKVMYANANKSMNYLDILTEKLIDYGLRICELRQKFLEAINNYIGKIYFEINGIDNLNIKYQSDFKGKTKEQLLKIYAHNRERDMLFGITSVGVHHDDYSFSFGNDLLKDFASQGQQKNAIISYKMAVIEYFKVEKHTRPILILDDLFSELDMTKVSNILKVIDKDIQVFITLTDIDKLPMNIRKESKIFNCINGSVEEEI